MTLAGVTIEAGRPTPPRDLMRLRRSVGMVFQSFNHLALYALYAGCSGLIRGGANIAPRTCVALVQAASRGEWDRAREIWASLEPLMSLLWEGDYVQSVYAAAELTGYGAGDPRKPLRPLGPDRIKALRTALGDLVEREAVTP